MWPLVSDQCIRLDWSESTQKVPEAEIIQSAPISCRMVPPETNAFFGGRRVGFRQENKATWVRSLFWGTRPFFRCSVLWRFDCLISLWFSPGRRWDKQERLVPAICGSTLPACLQSPVRKSWMADQIYHQHYLWATQNIKSTSPLLGQNRKPFSCQFKLSWGSNNNVQYLVSKRYSDHMHMHQGSERLSMAQFEFRTGELLCKIEF